MKKTCYIFLDMDGVVNNTNFWERTYKKTGRPASFCSTDKRNLRNLRLFDRLMKHRFDVHYVLSSTWRLSDDMEAAAYDILKEYGIILEGDTSRVHADRGLQILQYMKNIETYDYIISLDDDDFDILSYLNDYFYLLHTNCERGLTKIDIIDFYIKLLYNIYVNKKGR